MLKNKKDLENENRLENLKELLRAMQDYDNFRIFRACCLSNFNRSRMEGAKINLMTMHAAKGLGLTVFLPGWKKVYFSSKIFGEEILL